MPWFLRLRLQAGLENRRLLFAQGQLLQALRPQGFRKAWGEGRATLPTRCCLPPPCCLQEVAREMSTLVTSASAPISDPMVIQLLMRKLRHADPPRPLSASPRLSLLPPLQNGRQAAFCWGRVSGAHLVACGGEGQPGSRAGDGGEQEEGCGWKSSCWVGGRGSALNRGPQLGFHNDISGGQAELSAIQMGKLRRESSSVWEGRGCPAAVRTTHLPHENTDLEPEHLISGHSMFKLRHRSGRQLGHLAPEPPSTLDKPEGNPPPPQLPGEGVGLWCPPACLPCSRACKRLILAPGLLSLPGGSSGNRAGKRAAEGDREIWTQGPGGCLIVLFSPPQRGPGTERGPQPPCSVEMKRTLSWS